MTDNLHPTCEHKFIYQGIVYEDEDEYLRRFYHMYFCEKCLKYEYKRFETSLLNNRFHTHPYPQATRKTYV